MRIVTIALAASLAALPASLSGSQRQATSAEEVKALQQMAAAIPLGSRVRVQVRGGRRMTATLMSVTDEGIVIQRDTRVPEPAMTVPFAEIARLQRDEGGGGVSVAKAIGIGVAAGAAAILTMIAIAFALD